jgi:hypothetical protein
MNSRTPRVTSRTSIVFVGTAEATRVYRSAAEVPSPLRKRLEETTSGANSATILIADRRGREELVRALQGLPSDVQSRLARTIQSKRSKADGARIPALQSRGTRFWLELTLPFVAGSLLWLLLSWKA